MPLLTSFGGLVAGRASCRKNSSYKTLPVALPPHVPVGRFRMMRAVLPIIVQCVNNGGGMCVVGGDAGRECCSSDRPTRASVEKRTFFKPYD